MTTVISGSYPAVNSDSDATVNGLTVGKGGGSVASNTVVGVSSLSSNVSGVQISAFGNLVLPSNTGSYNSSFGYGSSYANTTGQQNSAFGAASLNQNTTGSYNTAVGLSALNFNTTASNNTAVGYQAGYSNTATANTFYGYKAGYTNSSGNENTFIGTNAGFSNLTASGNTIIGINAYYTNSTGNYNTVLGDAAGYSATGGSNTLLGLSAAANLTTGSNNTVIGTSAGNSSGVINLTTQSNRVVIGDANVSNAYILVAWTVTSDARDKTDVSNTPYGLNFVNELRPITYKWDKRDKYENKTPDGTHKEPKTQLGFLAQDVIELEKKYGGVAGDLLIADDETEESLKITETKMIPILVKAIQEQQTIIESLTTRLTALETP